MMQYVLKLSIALAVVYLFYWLLLRKLTFYNWNRLFLLFYSMGCFLIPLIDIGSLLQQHGLQDNSVVLYIPVLVATETAASPANTGFDWNRLYAVCFVAGCVLMGGRLLLQYLSLKKLQASAELISDGRIKLYHVDRKIIPFSTRSAIYVNRYLHNEQELKEIIHHEFIHVKQRHSIDLWWGEILCILNWYNPFAWLIRKAMRQNLEFIADHQVLQSGLDRKQYQYLLLKVTGVAGFSIAANFNFSSLKKRIMMMNKHKSANVHLMRFGFMLPLLAVVLLAFRSVAVQANLLPVTQARDTIPAPEKPGAVDKTKHVRQITVKENSKATITFKDGSVKSYDLTKPGERAAFEKEYCVPPAPPAPPKPAKSGHAALTPAPPVPPASVKTSASASPGSPAPVNATAPAPPASPKPTKSGVPAPPTPPQPPVPENTGIAAFNATGSVKVNRNLAAEGPVKGTTNGHGTTTLEANVLELKWYEPGNVPLNRSWKATAAAPLLTIDAHTSRQDLNRSIQELQEKGYKLDMLRFMDLVYNDDKLVALHGRSNDGHNDYRFTIDRFAQIILYAHNGSKDQFFFRIHNGKLTYLDQEDEHKKRIHATLTYHPVPAKAEH